MSQTRLTRAVPLLALLVVIPVVLMRLSTSAPLSSDVQFPTVQQLIQDNLARGRLVQALYQIEALAAQNGWTGDLSRSAGQVWERMGDLSQAAGYWSAAAQHAPDDAVLLRRLSLAQIELQQWPEAADTLRRLAEQAPDDNRAHYLLGLLTVADDPGGAGEHLRLAARDLPYRDVAFDLLPLLSANTASVSTMMQVGLVLAGHDLWPYAERAFAQAAALGRVFPEAFAYLGLARDRQGKDGGGAMQKALALDPDNAQVMYLNGLHLRIRYDYAGSLEAFVKAATADPANPAYAAELATAYRLVGDLLAAEVWLKAAVTLSNHDPRFEDLLAAFYDDLERN